MLRRKLQLLMFLLTAVLLSLALAAVWSLEGVFDDMDHINHQSLAAVENSEALNAATSTAEVQLYGLQAKRFHTLDALIDAVDQMDHLADKLGTHSVVHEPAIAPVFNRVKQEIDAFRLHIAAGATIEDPVLQTTHSLQALEAVARLRHDIQAVSSYANQRAQREQDQLTARFRWLVIGMSVAFLLAINLSIALLLRMATLILKPVDELVEASRQLAAEHFDYRVSLTQKDEFDELAQAYNHLAQQLQENEQRKIEMLQQAALALNHELNNAMAIIDLQLRLLQKKAGDTRAFADSLRQINETMGRMAKVVESFRNIRRIVLTDYVGGVRMLDLERSAEPAATAATAPEGGPGKTPAGNPPAALPAATHGPSPK